MVLVPEMMVALLVLLMLLGIRLREQASSIMDTQFKTEIEIEHSTMIDIATVIEMIAIEEMIVIATEMIEIMTAIEEMIEIVTVIEEMIVIATEMIEIAIVIEEMIVIMTAIEEMTVIMAVIEEMIVIATEMTEIATVIEEMIVIMTVIEEMTETVIVTGTIAMIEIEIVVMIVETAEIESNSVIESVRAIIHPRPTRQTLTRVNVALDTASRIPRASLPPRALALASVHAKRRSTSANAKRSAVVWRPSPRTSRPICETSATTVARAT